MNKDFSAFCIKIEKIQHLLGKQILMDNSFFLSVMEKHGEPCVVPISTKFSDPNNYRGIHEKLKQAYRRSKTRRGNGKWIDPLDSHSQLLALQSVYMNPTGGKIIEEAKRGMGRVMSAHDEKEFCYTGCLKGIDGTAVKKESQLMKNQSKENKRIVEGQEAAKFTPFPVMNVSNLGGDVEHIKYLLTSSSGFMLRVLETVCGINRTT
ncbi:hypothetical protein CAEBREN_16984 [Caenorhabditis brenneri]|uniref:Uncharacterized protein n=1 Tax=Caenorhabditis brenneri TaxID=135651 RepID=G0P576_CAEBE|nr:hypothetical protein CAEBREN_16984 [Caenorhabditis brenneri]